MKEELRELEEAIWSIFNHHWNHIFPRGDYEEAKKSGEDFEKAKKALEKAGGSWEKLKQRKEDDLKNGSTGNARNQKALDCTRGLLVYPHQQSLV